MKYAPHRQFPDQECFHDSTKDLVRLDLRTEQLAEPVERFTIAVVPLGGGGEIRFDWDRTRWVLPFTVK